ncbi:MAG: hypothetical protein EOO77_06570 [Oxalobacteraceae bacterium]|nr:MAG: hypothetical protein EOO77_06570 [Oxalobacteraceae bacterium]
MPIRISGKFAKNGLSGVSFSGIFPQKWMTYAGEIATRNIALIPNSSSLNIPGVADSVWFSTYLGATSTLNVSSLPNTAKYDTTQDTNPALWFTSYTAVNDSSRAVSTYPSTAAYTLSRPIPDSSWYGTYAGAADSSQAPASYPTTARYEPGRTIPADTAWYTYSGAVVVDAPSSYPNSALSAA